MASARPVPDLAKEVSVRSRSPASEPAAAVEAVTVRSSVAPAAREERLAAEILALPAAARTRRASWKSALVTTVLVNEALRAARRSPTWAEPKASVAPLVKAGWA